ncbi:hypothetical protein NUW58_g2596 [Xylaria curta]|uniref:Uncharacterized protein n=1 Tax=Xylaria curta TaxID=42375 RepID=A0ACC1PFZ2_9PEZI|nr:hypothetical protein NUW58_g2596 [Xylaria curta]
MKAVVTGLAALAGIVSADVALWGQCGGIGYTGETKCATGASCQISNEYYSQCVPGTDATTLSTTTRAATTTAAGGAADPTGFPSTSGLNFQIDGKTGYFAGTNSYWIGFLTNNADVDKALDELKKSGLKILRVWGFNDVTSTPGQGTVWFQRLSASGSTINTGTNGLQRLDYVVSSAEKRGIKLIINFVNNWSDYGGIPAYVSAFGGSAKTWYTNTAAQTQYRAYIKAVVSRYASSSAVFAWELANEPRCNGCATSVVTKWATETSAYVKSLDSKHMVTLGDEGFGVATNSDGELPVPVLRGRGLRGQPEDLDTRLRDVPSVPRVVGHVERLGEQVGYRPRRGMQGRRKAVFIRGVRFNFKPLRGRVPMAENRPRFLCFIFFAFPLCGLAFLLQHSSLLRRALALAVAAVAVGTYGNTSPRRPKMPAQAQFIDQKAFNVLPSVPPPSEFNLTSIFVPPGYDLAALLEKPFHIYDDEFYDVIGPNPTLTLIAHNDTGLPFHEAVVWYPPTNEVFFVQNAGARAAGTGLNKSAIIQKISLAEADAVSTKRNATGLVKVHVVDSKPMVLNPNGAINYKGQLLFAAEGQGADKTTNLVIMNPREPYNTTVLLNNYYGRQFNSLNDMALHPRNKDVYFTDPIYGLLQDFRPKEGLPHQVYRYNDRTGAVTVVADGLSQPNGIVFSPSGSHAYVADTGAQAVFWGINATSPATIYRYDVAKSGTWSNRQTFAHAHAGIPDGLHVDTKGRLYAGCGDGVHVFNPSGTLIGKIFLGEGSANFNFAGDGGMVMCAETNLFYAKIAATSGAYTGDD